MPICMASGSVWDRFWLPKYPVDPGPIKIGLSYFWTYLAGLSYLLGPTYFWTYPGMLVDRSDLSMDLSITARDLSPLLFLDLSLGLSQI